MVAEEINCTYMKIHDPTEEGGCWGERREDSKEVAL
jgi:hypothetical protein